MVNMLDWTVRVGCGCKLDSSSLAEVLRPLANSHVGADDILERSLLDSAPLTVGDRQVCYTIDFGTPIVEDAEAWGAVAANSALSDVYVSAGRPLAALAILIWPKSHLELTEASRVLQGASGVLDAAGAALVGGHTVDGEYPMFGLSIVGEVDDDLGSPQGGPSVGDKLVMTKALGVGIAMSARKQRMLSEEAYLAAVDLMLISNHETCHVALNSGASALTDISGFGLIGHAGRLAERSGLAARLYPKGLRTIEGVEAALDQGLVPNSTEENYLNSNAEWNSIGIAQRMIASDPQTAGGVLISIPDSGYESLAKALEQVSVPHALIGEVVDTQPGEVAFSGE